MDEQGNGDERMASARSEASVPTPNRSDFSIKTREISNGDRRPIETYAFSQAMRHWREQSSQSTLRLG